MKKLLGILMLTIMVVVGSAFTAEDAPFATTFLYRTSANGPWLEGSGGPNCTGAQEACKIRFERTDVNEDFYQAIGNAAGATSPYSYGPFDHDKNTNTAQITLDVTVVARFPIAP